MKCKEGKLNRLKNYLGLWRSNDGVWLVLLDKVAIESLDTHFFGHVFKMPGVSLEARERYSQSSPPLPRYLFYVFDTTRVVNVRSITYGRGGKIKVYLVSEGFNEVGE